MSDHKPGALHMQDGKGNYSIAVCNCGWDTKKLRGDTAPARANHAKNKHAEEAD